NPQRVRGGGRARSRTRPAPEPAPRSLRRAGIADGGGGAQGGRGPRVPRRGGRARGRRADHRPRRRWVGGAEPPSPRRYVDPADVPRAWMGRALTVDVEAKAKERAVLRLARDLGLQRASE